MCYVLPQPNYHISGIGIANRGRFGRNIDTFFCHVDEVKMAGAEGLEPPVAGLEPAGLPLTDTPTW